MFGVKEERFDMLVNVLRIIEKKRNSTSMENMMEIVDNYSDDFTPDQKSKVLRHILKFSKSDDDRSRHFREAETVEREKLLSKVDNWDF